MGSIQARKRNDGTIGYRAQVRMLGSEYLTETFNRRTDAKDWIRRVEEEIKNGNAPSSEARTTTLHKALDRYSREVTVHKKGKKRELDRIKVWQTNCLAHRFLASLRGTQFAEYRDARRAEGAAEGTIRTELALISHLFKVARTEWGMTSLPNPIKNIKMPGKSRERKRRLKEGEEAKLLAELAKAPYMAEMASLAIETCMRQGELLALYWANIDAKRRIAHLRDTKNSEPREVPLTPGALEILKAIPRPLDDAAPIFPTTQNKVVKAFAKACTAAALDDLRFHDLRHEAITRLCKKLPMHEAMRVTGHKTPAMLMRYYHPDPEELAQKLAENA
jgi:integrase